MKKLLVCLLIFIAILDIAHLRGGVTLMPAHDLADRSASGALRLLGSNSVFLSISGPVGWVLHWFLLPGAYSVSRVGLDPAARLGLGMAAFIGWWGWLSLARIAWSVSGRLFGWYSIGAFHIWLRFAPPWRPLYRMWLRFAFWCRQHGFGKRATGEWAGTLTLLANSYRPGKSIYLGRAQIASIGLHQPVGIEGDGHGVVIGNTGSGKTRFLGGWIGSLPEEASALVIDCGGATSDALVNPMRRAGHKVHVWDPFGVTKFETCHWNALDEMDRAVKRHGPKAAVRVAKKIARALVKELNEKQAIFTHGAREFVAALILYIFLTLSPELRNLVTLRQFLALGRSDLVTAQGQDPFEALLNHMLSTLAMDDGCDGAIVSVIARGAGVMKSGKTREGNPFKTSALVATEFIDIPEVAETMLRSDFTLEGLKLSNDMLFVAAPVNDIRSDLAGFMSVLVTLTAFTFQNIKQHRRIPCAIFLDEAPHIGIEDLPLAAANYRKDDMRLILATQDLPILEAAYPNGGWRTLMGSAAVRLWLSNGEISTHKYMCEELGDRTLTEHVEAGEWPYSSGPARSQRVERPMFYLDQARDFLDRDAGNLIATRTGKRPFKLKFDGYDRALPFWRFDPLPKYREPFLRRVTRAIAEALFPPKPPKENK